MLITVDLGTAWLSQSRCLSRPLPGVWWTKRGRRCGRRSCKPTHTPHTAVSSPDEVTQWSLRKRLQIIVLFGLVTHTTKLWNTKF